jgi:hypothetical protein
MRITKRCFQNEQQAGLSGLNNTFVASDEHLQPVSALDRHAALDVQGAALFGVLMMNLETVFRVSLFQHMSFFTRTKGA